MVDWREWNSIGCPWMRDGLIVGECRYPPHQLRYNLVLAMQNVRLAKERGASPREQKALREQLLHAERALERARAREKEAQRRRQQEVERERARAMEAEELERAAREAAEARKRCSKPAPTTDSGRGAILDFGIPASKVRQFYEFRQGNGAPMMYVGGALLLRDDEEGVITRYPMPYDQASKILRTYRTVMSKPELWPLYCDPNDWKICVV